MRGDGGWWRVLVPKPGGGLGDANTELGLEDLKFGLGSATSNYRNLSRPQSPHQGPIKAFWGGPGHICLCEPFPP